MSAIYLKELKTYFKSIFGWIFLAVFTFFGGYFFVAVTIKSGSPYISDTLGTLVTVLVFSLPLITMRSFSEEKRQKTDQLLLTSPVALWKIVLGKFFALCTIITVATLIISTGLIVIAAYGKLPVSDTILSLVGFLILSYVLIAIGMFISSITEYQILAAILTLFANIFTMLVPEFIYNLVENDTVVNIATNLYIYGLSSKASNGILDLVDLVFSISVIAIFLILTYKVFAKNSIQANAVGRNQYFVSNLAPFVIILVIIGVNVGVHYIPDKYMEYDLTFNKIYSISDTTKQVLKDNTDDITITVYETKDGADQRIKYYINDYQRYSNKIKVVYKDPKAYEKTESSVAVSINEKVKELDYYDMFEWQAYNNQYYISNFNIEQSITEAIVTLKDENATISVPTKDLSYDSVIVTGAMYVVLKILFATAIPLLCVAIGLAVVIFKKKIAAYFSRG